MSFVLGLGRRPSIIVLQAFVSTLLLLPTLTTSYRAYAYESFSKKAQGHAVSIRFGDMATCAATAPAPPSPPQQQISGSMPPPVVSFDGMSRGGSCRNKALEDAGVDVADWPSDDSGAVGPHHYMQSVNLALSVYDRVGNLLAGPVRTDTFWSALSSDSTLWDATEGSIESCNDRTHTDMVVLYDRQADRWVVSRPGGADPDNKGAGDGRLLCIAISQTGDPTGKYDQYAFLINSKSLNTGSLDFSTYFNDYPKMGIGRDAYYVTANPNKIFNGVGNTVTAFDRSALLAGKQQPQYVTFFVPAPSSESGPTHSHMLPADLDGNNLPAAGTPEYIVQVQDANFGFPSPGQLQVYELLVDWTNASAASLTSTSTLTPTHTFNSKACDSFQLCIQQPRISNSVDSIRLDSLSYGYMMYRLAYRTLPDRETLLLNHTVAADGDPSKNHSGLRWYELRKPAGAAWTIYQEGTYALNDFSGNLLDRWLGSIAMDSRGDIALGFDVSSAGVFPSIHYVGRRDSDPLGQLPVAETPLIDGKGLQVGVPTDNFFGDYSQMTLDPVDDCTIWYTNTYYPHTFTPDDWHTRIGAFRFPACIGFFMRAPILAINPGDLQFNVRALLAVNPGGRGINPVTNDVVLELGAFSVTIPAGSFGRHGEDGAFRFQGRIQKVHLDVEIEPREDGSFQFEALGRGATNLPASNPVTVGLTIGNRGGTATVAADFRSEESDQGGRRG